MLMIYPKIKELKNETVLTAKGVKSVVCTKYAVIAASTKPVNTPGVLACFVKMLNAKIPAIGTPNSPVISKNRFQVSARFVATRYKAAATPFL